MIRAANEGGFVYPLTYHDETEQGLEHTDRGITKRDWFAAMAMQGMVVGSRASNDSMHPTTALEVARAAYHYADMMLRMSVEDVPEAENQTA